MKNFDYLKNHEHLADLYAYCHTAEVKQASDPEKSALNSRKALEWLVRNVYRMKNIEVSDRTSLYTLIDGEPFQKFVGDDRLMMAVHYIRKVGNKAAHSNVPIKSETFFAVLNLYNFTGAVLKKLRVIEEFPPFDRELLKRPRILLVEPTKEPAADDNFVASIETEKITDAPVETRPNGFSEAETRRFFIDMMLQEAGWEVLDKQGAILPLKACIEVKVEGMPTESKEGFADYVLFGANGKPLAIVEAKRTSVSIEQGKQQAKLYADCMEAKYGVRPVLYVSNGYLTEVNDGLGYPWRPLLGFHTAEELELLIQRRGRKEITDLRINDSITNREYQKRAIRTVCERFNKKHRRTLLVMATGTGKTRVSISLTEVLKRNNWVKNVLFLADRTALVRQAAKNYAKLLPNESTCILSDEREPDMNARILFSTYQTMINYIDGEKKPFSIGRFDLIIIDEAHRSVFGKYTAIFDYFDGLLVGLTATPREEVEKNTFDLFKMDAADTFAYELDEAVADGYLVPYNALKRGTLILKEGIAYDKLSQEEKEQMEAVWTYEKARKALDEDTDYHRDIENNEINNYIYNEDTIKKVLQDLMETGLRVQSGERIGKTIVFAQKHRHAELIVKCFGELYPEYGSDFCVLIDNQVNYAQTLIDAFEVREKLPQIAVSVDMMDTGIDVPDVLNLVFFKRVRSKIKFMQMIGRGTRLSEHIYGSGEHKQGFQIFDWCNNFEYFGKHPNGSEAIQTQSLTERLFCLRTDIAHALQSYEHQQDAFAKGWHDELKRALCEEVKSLNDMQIAVRQHWPTVDRYRKEENWVCLTLEEAVKIKGEIAPLLPRILADENAKKFDVLMLNIELSKLVPEVNANRSQNKVVQIASMLREKASIPQVKARMNIINEVCTPEFWEAPSLSRLEKVREELRDLVKMIVGGKGETFTLNIRDEVTEKGEAEPFLPTNYKQRITDYLATHRNIPVIQKIVNMEQLTSTDINELERVLWKELGTKEDYDKYVAKGNLIYGDSVAAFIRSQVGIDRSVAVQKFSEFLSGHILNAEQEEYLKAIITYVCQNGDITRNTLINEPPLNGYDWIETFGQHFVCVRDFVDKLHDTIVVA